MLVPDEADRSALRRADDHRTPDGPAAAGAVTGQVNGAGLYLTDEVFLYRVTGFVAGEGDGMVELEDCYGLDVVRIPLAGLRAQRLRIVIPAAA
jgi:hypothetical protein